MARVPPEPALAQRRHGSEPARSETKFPILVARMWISANGVARPCSYPVRRRLSPGNQQREEHIPCHVNQRHPQSPQSASISARWNEEMDERPARRNQKTRRQFGPSRSVA
jgi:hypothetical protein